MNRRLISAGLSITMLFSAVTFTGCRKKTQKKELEGVKKITADSSWFDAATMEIDDIYKDKKTTYCEKNIIGAFHGGLVVRAYGEYALSADSDWKKGNSGDSSFDDLLYFDADGKLINTVDLQSAVSDSDNQYVAGIIVGDDRAYLYKDDCDTFHDGERSYYLAGIDLEKGVIGEFEKMPYTSKEVPFGCYGSWSIGDYLVFCHDEVSPERICFIIYNNGKCEIADLTAAFPSEDFGLLSGCMPVSEKEVVFIYSYSDVNFVSLNLETGKFQIKDEEYSWLNNLTRKESISSFDGKSYITDQGGIKRINLNSKQLEEIVSFDNCNLNRYVMDKLSLFSVQGDAYIFAGDINIPNAQNQFSSGNGASDLSFITLTKAGTNPHAGKAVITAAAIGNSEVPYPICEAIRIFNDTNKDYYIQLLYNYDIRNNLDYSSAQTDDEVDDIYYRNAADLNDLLAINMLSGDGPDIILNAGDIRQIQTEKHLVDLSSYVSGENGIHTEDYFSNVIDAAKKDGRLLFMPVSFGVTGISVEKSDIRDGSTGFTYDEYAKYVSEACNGKDPMMDSRLGVLCTLYSCMSDPCISGNTVNFNTAPFRSICEYVKNNIPEKFNYDMDLDGNETYSGLATFLAQNTYLSAKKTLLGYPSSDACGPVISIDTSIGISASAPAAAVDGAWEFIKTCLGDDVQELISRDYTNPMNKKIFDSSAKEVLERYNRSEISLGITMDESVIESYKDVLQSASVPESEDPAVLNIIREEIPAYFLEQKSLDAVLDIITNRVSTIIAERNGSVNNAK